MTGPADYSRTTLLDKLADVVFGYDFFVSYSHADGKNFPLHLKRKLEASGFKVFLDQSEYVPGVDLRRETARQVRKSSKIVVVARDNALRSTWVRREVDTALQAGKIPILIDVGNAVARAPTEAGLAALARDSHWLRINEIGDDPDGVPSDYAIAELTRSFGALRQESKRQRILGLVSLVLAGLTASSTYLAYLSDQRRKEADERLALTLETASNFVNKTAKMSDKYGVPREFVLDLLKEPERVFLDLANAGTDPPHLRQRKAEMLLDFVDSYEVLGNSQARVARAREAEEILAKLAAEDPRRPETRHLLATAHTKLGTALLFQGDRAGAKAEYATGLAIRKELAGSYPENRTYQRYYSVAINRTGELLLAEGDFEEARKRFAQARDIRSRLSSSLPDDREVKRDLFICQIWLGDSYKGQKRFEEAREEYDKARTIANELLKSDETSTQAMRDATVALNKIGETYLGRDDAEAALPFYEEALKVRERMAASDPPNRGWKRDLYVSNVQIGSVHRLRGETALAAERFRIALKLAGELSALDPKYGHWRADVLEAKGWLGSVSGDAGRDMLVSALDGLKAMKAEGTLSGERYNLIEQFQDILKLP